MNQLSKHPHLKWYVSNLRSIPGGSYRFGASPSQKQSGTRITMSPFRIGATPVTWGMWKEYRQALSVPGKGIKLPKDPGWGYPDDHPVVNVSWEDVMQPGGFCEWASSVAGFRLGLPSEAQWEYAVRGGKDGFDYPWGNEFDVNKLCCLKNLDAPGTTSSVDRSDCIYRNGYGLTDTVGNVGQWCADYYLSRYHHFGKDPMNTNGTKRIVRGGAYYGYLFCDTYQCHSRYWYAPDTTDHGIGFRLSAALPRKNSQ